MGCMMRLELFPLDSQTCHLTIASYGWTSTDVAYHWKEPEPVKFAENLFLPGGFLLAKHNDSKVGATKRSRSAHQYCLGWNLLWVHFVARKLWSVPKSQKVWSVHELLFSPYCLPDDWRLGFSVCRPVLWPAEPSGAPPLQIFVPPTPLTILWSESRGSAG